MPDSNHSIIKTVVTAMVIYAGVMVLTLCLCMWFQVTVDKDYFTAFSSILTFILGHISGTLNKTTPTTSQPNETKIINEKSDPIPTKPQK